MRPDWAITQGTEVSHQQEQLIQRGQAWKK